MKRLATVEGGRLELSGLEAFEGKRVVVSVELEKGRRSNAANARYWGVIVPVCASILSQGRELPLSPDQTHWLLKSAFLGCYETPLGLVPKESHTLDTHAFFDFTSAVEAHFRSEYGATFPDMEQVAMERVE